MTTFDNTVGAGVVWRDLNVEDVVLAKLSSEFSGERGSVVGDNLVDTTPATDNVLKDELSSGLSSIRAEHAEFRVAGQRAASLNDITVGVGPRKVHDIDMDASEERCRGGNDGRDVQVGGLAYLTLVACPDVPLDIVVHKGPPKSLLNADADGEEAFVTKFIMSGTENSWSSMGGND